MRRSYIIAGGLTLGLAGWLLSGQIGDGGSQAVEPAARAPDATAERIASVRVREVVAEPVERVVVVNGKTEPVRMVELRAETDGRVTAVGPTKGSRVAEGEVLVTLDPRERAAMIEQAEATLRQREIEHEAATRLGEKGFQAETKVAEAKATLEAARAALERARLDLGHTRIRAPFDGVLDKRPVEIGDFIDVGDPVATVVDQDPFLVTAEVSERDVGHLAAGMPGSARLITGQEVEGELRYVGSVAHPGTRTFEIELEVPNPDGHLTAGVSAELTIAYEKTLAHRVPSSLLTLSDEGALGVKAVNGDDEVVFYRVDIVRAEADAVWLAGLPERLRLISVGQGFVRAGDQVEPVPEQSAVEPGPLVAEKHA